MQDIVGDLIQVSEQAAIAAGKWVGKRDGIEADRAAVDAMRKAFDKVPFKGIIVIGEGERDEAPMLHNGEIVGCGDLLEFDIAVDPLECTTNCANNSGPSMSAMVVAERGMLLNAPDIYMEKIVTPIADGINLDNSLEENLLALSKAKGCKISDLTVAMLDRERHKKYMAEITRLGAKLELISDGDIAYAIMAATQQEGIDMYYGIGGAPEGVIAAAAISMLGGHMEVRLSAQDDEQKSKAIKSLGDNFEKKRNIDELVNISKKGALLFLVTGVTNGPIVKGLDYGASCVCTETFSIYRNTDGKVLKSFIKNEYKV